MPVDVSRFVTPAAEFEQLNQAANLLQQDRRNKEMMAYREQKDKEGDEWKRTSLVSNETDPMKIATGDVTADKYFQEEAKRVQREILSNPNFLKLPPNELFGLIQEKWLPVVYGAASVKNGLSQIDANVKIAGTENKSLAVDKLSEYSKRKFLSELIGVGDDGKPKYNINNYTPNKNYVQDVLNSPDRWRFIQGGDSLINYIKNYKTTQVSPHKQLADKTIIPFKGQQTPFVKLTAPVSELGRMNVTDNVAYDISTEDDFIYNDGAKVPIKTLSKDVYENHIQNIPANKDAMDFLWNSYKEKNGITPKNDTEEDKMKRAFAVGVFKANDPSEITASKPEHLPRNITNINTGSGSGSKVNDVYSNIELLTDDPEAAIMRGGKRIGTRMNALSGDEQKVVFDQFGGRKDDFNEKNTFIHKDNGVIKLYRVNENGQPDPKPEFEVGGLKKVGTNIRVQTGKAGEDAVVLQGENKTVKTDVLPNPTSKKKVYNPKTGKFE